MKKIIKIVLIVVVVIGIVVGGLFFGYRYNQGKKTAEVAPLSNYAMDDYWGDSIESYGEVTAEKSQVAYIDSESEIKSVNVKVGDHVEEGDVIITVAKETQDINNKILEIAKANQGLKVEQIKLQRLMNTKPAPTYVYSQDVDKDYHFVEKVQYKASTDYSDDGHGGSYKEGDVVAEEGFTYDGVSTGFTYYFYNDETDGEGNTTRKSYTADSLQGDLKSVELNDTNFTINKKEGVYTYLRSTTYYDAETNKMVGEINYTMEGEVESEHKVPEGMNAQELQEAIADAQSTIKQQDLEIRKLQSELQVMKNTDDNGEIKAKVSGTVSKIQDKDNYNKNIPFFVVTATDEYYITGSIGEFYLNSVHIGDEVTVDDWETGNSTQAVITAINDTPKKEEEGYWGGDGNSNVSNYEFKATFDKSCGIEIGSTVNISITPQDAGESSLYIPSYFIKKDSAGSYVMRMNKKKKLEKVYIKVGKKLWGEMTEVKSGITNDDYLAFPYGNGEREGIKCEIIDFFEDGYGGIG